MPNNRGRRRRGGQQRARRRGNQGDVPASYNPPVAAAVYRGPWRPPAVLAPPPITIALTWSTPLTASGTGIVAYSFVADPTQSAEWSTMLALYAECRILALTTRYVPSQHYYAGSGTNDPGVMIWYTSHNAAYTVPSSLDAALQYSDSRPSPGDMPVRMTARMSGMNEAIFYNVAYFTSTQPALFLVGVYGTQFTPSAPVGFAFQTILCQFRNRA